MRPLLGPLLAPLVASLALTSCGGDGSREPERRAGPIDSERDASTSPATSDGGSPAIPAHGFRSDWFDVFAVKKATRFDLPVRVLHDATSGPVPGLRGILYSARFSGRVSVEQSGDLSLFVTSDDGVRVSLDGTRIIDDWRPRSPAESVATVPVTEGTHELVLEYFQMRGNATLVVEWQPPGGPRSPIPTSAVTPLATAPVDASGAELGGPRPLFSNPVVPFDCPDPGVVSAPTPEHPRWLMVCTGGAMPIRASDDLVVWTDTGNALLPGGKAAWSANGERNWAPEIHKVGAGWVAYYTAVNAANVLSIGCAHATAPEGPYTDCGAPLVEHPQGVIDATYFEDAGGKRYLYYKIDGNSVGAPTPIFARELAADGRSFAAGSAAVQVLTSDAATWEGGVAEAPWVVAHDGLYYLFYSGNVFDFRYRMGVARATSPLGPFTKKSEPILSSSAQWVGPGHGSVVRAHGRDVVVHHAWYALPDGTHDGARGRVALVTPVSWKDGWPVLGAGRPSDAPLEFP